MIKFVVCIDNKEADTWLSLGDVYEVEGENASNYFMLGKNGGFRKSRFEDHPTTTVFMAECIDDLGVRDLVTKGNKYELRIHNQFQCNVIGAVMDARRFRIVSLLNQRPIVAPQTVKVAASKQDDKARELSFFRSRSNPQECPCGSTRGVCPYHPS